MGSADEASKLSRSGRSVFSVVVNECRVEVLVPARLDAMSV